MSVMRCKRCDLHVDTDYCDTGIFDDGPPYGFTCGDCVEREEMEAADYLSTKPAAGISGAAS